MSGEDNGERGTRRRARTRLLLAATALIALAALGWAALAAGTQPYETYKSAVSADGPVTWYRFDDAAGSTTLADSAGTNTATNSAITLAGEGPFPGSKSGAFGTESFATLASNPLGGATAFTVEAWVNWTSSTAYGQPVFDLGSAANNHLYLTPASTLASHPMLFEISHGGVAFQVTAPKLTAAVWKYVTLSETSAGAIALYVNGEKVGEHTSSLSPSSLGTLAQDYLGKSVSGNPSFKGRLSNVAFYNKALAASQILAHYRAAEYPVNTVAPSITGTPTDGKTLAAKAGTWTGLTPMTPGYQWIRCNNTGTGCVPIEEETTNAKEAKYVIGDKDIGQTLRVVLTEANTAGSGTATSPQTAAIAAVKPIVVTVPVISGEAKVGQELTSSAGTWEGSPVTKPYKYEWQLCNGAGEKCKVLAGVESNKYEPNTTQLGDTLRVIVTAENSAGATKATSKVTALIAAGPPRNTTLPSVTGTPEDGEPLTLQKGKWSGTEPIAYSYSWERCTAPGHCTEIAGQKGTSYTLKAEDVNDTVRGVVTAENSVAKVSAIAPETQGVAARAPTDTAPPTVSGAAKDGGTLTTTNGTWAGTPTINYSYTWERCDSAGANCSPIEQAIQASYHIVEADIGHTLRATVTAHNGGGEASSTSAASAVIAATAPQSTQPPTIEGEPQDEHTLTATPGAWTGTAPITYTYSWERCAGSETTCAPINGATSASYTVQHADVQATLRVTVTAHNGAGTQSATATTPMILAAPPANITPPTVEGTAEVGQTLTSPRGSWSGTPPISYAYQWQSCNSLGEACMPITGATHSTYQLGAQDAGTTLRAAVTASNTAGSVTATSGAAGPIAGGVPTNTQPPTLQGTAVEGHTLVVTNGQWHGTEPLTYGYEWQRCIAGVGSLGSGAGQFNVPGAIAIDPEGNLWVVDRENNRVEELTSSGEYVSQFGSEGSGNGQLSGPDGIAIDGGGNLWVADRGNDRIEEFNKHGEYLSQFGGEGTEPGQLAGPEGIAIDAQDHIWVSDTYNARVQEYSHSGELVRVVGASGEGKLGEPEGLAIDAGGNVWVADWANNRVAEFNANGEFQKTIGSGGSGNGQLERPYAITVDGGGDVWVGDIVNDRVEEFDSHGSYLSQFGTPGQEAGQLRLRFPMGLAFDHEGQLWLTDTENNRLQQFLPDGQVIPHQHCTTITGATSATYQLTATDRGAQLRAIVTAANAAGHASADSEPSAIVTENQGEPPTPVVAPAISGTSRDKQTLSATTGTWAGAEPIAYSYQWERCNGTTCSPIEAATEATYALSDQDVGATIKVTVTATNAAGADTSSSAPTATIAAAPPENHGEPLITGNTRDGSTLTATTGSWEGTPPITYSYQWQSCDGSGEHCEALAGETQPQVTLGHATVGRTLRVTITARNAGGEASQTSASTTVVTPLAPSETTRPVITAQGEGGKELTVNPGTWEGTTPLGFSYAWELCDSEGEACRSIPGANTATITLSPEQRGRVIRAQVTATNSGGSATALALYGATPPSSLAPPYILGEARVGAILTASNGAWTGSLPLQYSYQWQSCDANANNCTNLENQTNITYIPTQPDAGRTLRVAVTASGLEAGVRATSPVTPVISNPLRNTAAPTIAGTPQPSQTLTASTGSWNGEPPITYAYQWERCSEAGSECLEISAANTGSYAATPIDSGHTLRVRVTATSGSTSQRATSAATATIGQTAPSNTSLPVISGLPNAWQTLRASAGTWTGNGLTFVYQWERCNGSGRECRPLAGETRPELRVTNIVGATLRVVVGAANQTGSSAVPSSTVGPIKPELTLTAQRPPTVSGAPQVGMPLHAQPGTWSGTGPVSYRYQWQTCEESGEHCSPIGAANGETYTPISGDAGHHLAVQVTASDQNGPVSASSSPTATVAAAEQPAVAEAPKIEGTPEEGRVLTANHGMWQSNTTIEYRYQWELCDLEGARCQTITAASSSSYTLDASAVGHTLRVKVSASNESGTTTTTSPASAVVINTLTNIAPPTISPAEGATSEYRASAGLWDASGPATYTFQWLRCETSGNGCTPIVGATEASYVLAAADTNGLTLRVAVTARQGQEAITARSAPAGPIQRPASIWISGAGQVGSTLSAEGAPAGSSYQWERCNITASTCAAVAGATTRAYTLRTEDVGSSLRATATPPGEPTETSPGFPVGAPYAPPGGVKVEGATTTPLAGETLSVTSHAALGSQPIRESVQWQRCEAGGVACSDIANATATVYVITKDDIAHQLRALVGYANGFGSTSVETTATSTVAHSAPVNIASPALSWTGSLQPGTTLSANPGSWGGDPTISYGYQWEICNAEGGECGEIEAATQPSYTVAPGDVEHTIRATITAGNAEGATVRIVGGAGYEVTPAAGAPQNLTRPEILGTPTEGVPLSATTGAWTNVPTGTTYEYSWLRCVSERPSLESEVAQYHEGRYCQPISGATGATYTPNSSGPNLMLAVEVKPKNTLGLTGVALSPLSSPVAEGAPVNQRAPTVSGQAVAGNTLTATKGRWSSEYSTTIYQWQTCTAAGEECVSIAGASGTGYEVPAEDVGKAIRVQVTVETPGGSTTASSSPTGTVEVATAPSNTLRPSISGTPRDGETLSVGRGSWNGSPELTYTYGWLRCSEEAETSCAPIPGAAEASYSATRADVGNRLVATVTAENLGGAQTVRTNQTSAIAAAPAPTSLTVASLSYTAARYGEPITVTPGSWSGDPQITDRWQRCDPTHTDPHTKEPICANIEGADGLTYTPTGEDLGYQLRVLETASNPIKTLTKATEMTAAIGLREVQNEGASYSGLLGEGHVITATATLTTAPALPANTTTEFRFVRQANGEATPLQSGANASYQIKPGDVGAKILITVTTTVTAPGNSAVLESKVETLETPVVQGVLTDRGVPTLSGVFATGSTVSVAPGTWANDSRPLTYSYEWESCDESGNNCAPILAATGQTYIPTPLETGRRLRARVIASDGRDLGTAVTEASPQIQEPPAPTNVEPPTLHSPVAREGQPLRLEGGQWEGQTPVQLTYRWKICFGPEVPCATLGSASEAEYIPNSGDVGATIQGEVIAISGNGETVATTTPTEVVGAAPPPANVTVPTVTIVGPHTTEAILFASPGTWEGVDQNLHSSGFGYQWQRCENSGQHCKDIPSAIGSLYDATAADSNATLRVRVSAENGSGETSAASDATPVLAQSIGSARSAIAYAGNEQLIVQGNSASEAHPVATCAQVAGIVGEANCVFRHPAISPNGQMIAAEVRPRSAPDPCSGLKICPDADNSPSAKVILMNYDGSELRSLAQQGGQPTWSPDGTTILDVHTTEGIQGQTSQLQAVKLTEPATTTALPLPAGTESAQSPSYDPSGGRIAFVARNSTGGQWNIYLAGSEGQEPVEQRFEGLSSPDDPVILRGFPGSHTQIVFSAINNQAETEPKYGTSRPRALYLGEEEEELERKRLRRISPEDGIDYSAPRLQGGLEREIATQSPPIAGERLERHAWSTSGGSSSHTIETSGEALEAAPATPSEQYSAEGTPTGAASRARTTVRRAAAAEPVTRTGTADDALALKFSPFLWTDVSDGFAPISVEWGVRQRQIGNPYNTTKRCNRGGCSNAAHFPLTQYSGDGEMLKYPGGDGMIGEWFTTDNTLNEYRFNLIFPGLSKEEQEIYDEVHPNAQQEGNVNKVYYVIGRRHKHITIDYWYYYTFNYANGFKGETCEGEHGCNILGHDLHEGDLENVEIVLNQTRIGKLGTPYSVREYRTSRHGQMVPMSASETVVKNGHVMVYAAHGTHANYPVCNKEKKYPTVDIIIEQIYDYVCSEHFSRRPWMRKVETGSFLFGGAELQPENLAGLGPQGDKEQFACWKGLFGRENEDLGGALGKSPAAPLRQLDSELEEVSEECPRNLAS
jgi:sugar lactone lactonase YvrE